MNVQSLEKGVMEKYVVKNKNLWYLVEKCKKPIIHDVIDFKQFNIYYKNNKIELYNMNYKKYQEYYINHYF